MLLIPYVTKVVIISAIMFGYYWMALRNKKFHRFNRFYLLSAMVLPLIVPFINLRFLFANGDMVVANVLSRDVVVDNIVINANPGSYWNAAPILQSVYLLVAGLLFVWFLISLFRIFRLSRQSEAVRTHGIILFNTSAKGTPFSFFKNIFWNPDLDLNSAEGIKMLNHELTHCRQWHSLDKMIVKLICNLFWFNPIFWMIKNEIYLVHEFLADKISFQSDSASFSKIVLQDIYPGYAWSLTNSFFYSPIKRRIMMLLKNNQQKVSYIGRLLVLPLAIGLFIFFSTKANALTEGMNMTPVATDTVIQGSDIRSVSVDSLFVVITFNDGTTKTVRRSELGRVHIVEGDKNDTPPAEMDKLFTKVEVEAQFPGGQAAWTKFISKIIEQHIKELTEKDYGTCVVKFVIDTRGNVHYVEATTMKGTKLAEIAVDAILKGPKWIPAQQNGQNVNAYRLQPVTLMKP